MSTSNNNPPPTGSQLNPAGSVEVKIRALVEQIAADEDGSYRAICRLARRYELRPEHLRVLVLQAGLSRQRTSELITIFASEEACDAYLREVEPAARIDALRIARDGDKDALRKAAARLLRLLLRHGESWAQSDVETEWRRDAIGRGKVRFKSKRGYCVEVFMRVLPF